MVELYTPQDELELSLLKGLLEAEGVAFFVRNDTFGSMHVGPRIRMLNGKCILVDAADRDRARELVAEFVSLPPEEGVAETYSFFHKLRMVVEALLFTWFIPGRKGAKTPTCPPGRPPRHPPPPGSGTT